MAQVCYPCSYWLNTQKLISKSCQMWLIVVFFFSCLFFLLVFFFHPAGAVSVDPLKNILLLCRLVLFQFCSCWDKDSHYNFLKYQISNFAIWSVLYEQNRKLSWTSKVFHTWWVIVQQERVQMASNPVSYPVKTANVYLIQSKLKSEDLQEFTL